MHLMDHNVHIIYKQLSFCINFETLKIGLASNPPVLCNQCLARPNNVHDIFSYIELIYWLRSSKYSLNTDSMKIPSFTIFIAASSIFDFSWQFCWKTQCHQEQRVFRKIDQHAIAAECWKMKEWYSVCLWYILLLWMWFL